MATPARMVLTYTHTLGLPQVVGQDTIQTMGQDTIRATSQEDIQPSNIPSADLPNLDLPKSEGSNPSLSLEEPNSSVNNSVKASPQIVDDKEQSIFTNSSCGDKVSEANNTWYPVFINGGNLEQIRTQYCADAVSTVRQGTKIKTVQVASFNNYQKALKFALSVNGEVGEATQASIKQTQDKELSEKEVLKTSLSFSTAPISKQVVPSKNSPIVTATSEPQSTLTDNEGLSPQNLPQVTVTSEPKSTPSDNEVLSPANLPQVTATSKPKSTPSDNEVVSSQNSQKLETAPTNNQTPLLPFNIVHMLAAWVFLTLLFSFFWAKLKKVKQRHI